MVTDVYLHSNRDSMYDCGKRLGLTGDAANMFAYACYEVKLTVDVDERTGRAVITHVDERKVEVT